jgi:hypothetical protein
MILIRIIRILIIIAIIVKMIHTFFVDFQNIFTNYLIAGLLNFLIIAFFKQLI